MNSVKMSVLANVPFLPPRQMEMRMPMQTVHGNSAPAPAASPPHRPTSDVYSPSSTNTAAAATAGPRLADVHDTHSCFNGHF